MILIWVMGLVGGQEESPVPSVSGLGLNFAQTDTVTKKDGASRRTSLLSAHVGSQPSAGSLTINFNREISSSTWIWSVVQVFGSSIVRTAENGEGDWVKDYSVSFPSPSRPANQILSGFGMGNKGDPVSPGPGMRKISQAEASVASVYVQWGNGGPRTMSCSWNTESHAMAIGVEVAP
jgi:hypothetical protein